MRERQKILALVLAVLVLTVLAVILWLPSRSVKGSVDFGIRDENSNFHYEVGEQLSFVVSDSGLVRGKIYFGSWVMVIHFIATQQPPMPTSKQGSIL